MRLKHELKTLNKTRMMMGMEKRRNIRQRTALLFCCLLVLWFWPELFSPKHAPLAKAEWYFFKSGAQDSSETARLIKKPTHAQRFFGRLGAKSDVDYFSFTADQGTKITLVLLSPVADPKFRPSLTVFGPGLPRPKQDPSIPIGDQNGAYVLAEDKVTRTTAYDQYLFTSFYEGPHLDFTVPQTATYGLAVRSPDGNTGRYVLKIGSEDSWNWNELIDRIFGVIQAILRLY
jgi:hypothetical protein